MFLERYSYSYAENECEYIMIINFKRYVYYGYLPYKSPGVDQLAQVHATIYHGWASLILYILLHPLHFGNYASFRANSKAASST